MATHTDHIYMSVAVVPAALKPSAYIGARFSPGKVTLPLTNSVPYANFEHVRGVPAVGDQEGYTVNRLHILNAILERHARISGTRSGGGYAGAAQAESNRHSSAGEAHSGPSDADIARAAEALHVAARRSVYGVSYGTGLFETGVGVSMSG